MTESLNNSSIDPSLVVGNRQGTAEMLHAAMTEVIPILDMEDAESRRYTASAYIDRRVQELAQTDNGKPVGFAHGGTETFIGPQTAMIGAALMDKPYYLDDPKAYEAAVPTIKAGYDYYQDKLTPEKAYINAVIAGANYGQAVYFESYVGDLARRGAVSGDFIDEDAKEANSIADYKRVAVCQERAGVAHDTLLIFGVTSRLEGGYLESTDKDGSKQSEAHAFLVVTTHEGEQFIFDPTNPIVHKDKDGAIKNISPAIYSLNDPNADRQVVKLKQFDTAEDGTQAKSTRELTYYFGTMPIESRLS